MMSKGLKVAEPPRRRSDAAQAAGSPEQAQGTTKVSKFDHISENDKVQFNKRVTRRVADGYEMLAIRTRRKVPELLAEALELLEEKHGKS